MRNKLLQKLSGFFFFFFFPTTETTDHKVLWKLYLFITVKTECNLLSGFSVTHWTNVNCMSCPRLKGKHAAVYSTEKPQLMITHHFLSCKTPQANIYPFHFSGKPTNYLDCALSPECLTSQTIHSSQTAARCARVSGYNLCFTSDGLHQFLPVSRFSSSSSSEQVGLGASCGFRVHV